MDDLKDFRRESKADFLRFFNVMMHSDNITEIELYKTLCISVVNSAYITKLECMGIEVDG